MKKLVNVFLMFAFIIASIFSSSAFAGLFGPSNYEDCVLENIKSVTNDAAANAVRSACAGKFKPKNPPNYYRINSSRGKRDRELVNNIVVLKNFGQAMEVMNKNSFSIAGVYYGVLPKGVANCPSTENSFEAIYYCKGLGIVGGNQAGRISCSENIGTFCITGFLTDWLEEPEKFFKETGLK